jgi:hypothetical protein
MIWNGSVVRRYESPIVSWYFPGGVVAGNFTAKLKLSGVPPVFVVAVNESGTGLEPSDCDTSATDVGAAWLGVLQFETTTVIVDPAGAPPAGTIANEEGGVVFPLPGVAVGVAEELAVTVNGSFDCAVSPEPLCGDAQSQYWPEAKALGQLNCTWPPCPPTVTGLRPGMGCAEEQPPCVGSVLVARRRYA